MSGTGKSDEEIARETSREIVACFYRKDNDWLRNHGDARAALTSTFEETILSALREQTIKPNKERDQDRGAVAIIVRRALQAEGLDIEPNVEIAVGEWDDYLREARQQDQRSPFENSEQGWKAIAKSNEAANEEACKALYYQRETVFLIGEAMGWTREQMTNGTMLVRESLLDRVRWLEQEVGQPKEQQKWTVDRTMSGCKGRLMIPGRIPIAHWEDGDIALDAIADAHNASLGDEQKERK